MEPNNRFEGSNLGVPYGGAVDSDNTGKVVREQTISNDKSFEQTKNDDKQYSVPQNRLLSYMSV